MKRNPSELLHELADKHQFDTLLRNDCNPRARDRHTLVGQVVLGEKPKRDNSILKDLKSDDIKDKGLQRLEKPIKRKRSSVYKLGK